MGDGVASTERARSSLDLLRVPWLRRALGVRRGRRALQVLVLLVAIVMIGDGFLGPQLAPRNFATVFGWVHYRGLLILALLVAGNLFCLACPFVLVRDWVRSRFNPVRNWPARLRNKWAALALFVAILFSYELFDLWAEPRWTATLIVLYFAGAIVVDGLFRNAPFCKYLCPIGQFNFMASTLSPMEVRVREVDVCRSCKTLDCIRGRRSEEDHGIVLQRGCELALFQPKKVGNLDCTFCLDCVYACPHDNVGIMMRLPGEELATDVRRSGIGRISGRNDFSALAVVFTFGALLNAFAMVSPVYALQEWLGATLGTTSDAPVLATLFVAALVVEPALLLGGAAYVTGRHLRETADFWMIVRNFAFALVPLGVGVWAAHYSFHLLTGLWTWMPALGRLAGDVVGSRSFEFWVLPGLPEQLVYPLEIGLICLGLVGSLLVSHQVAARMAPGRVHGAFLPWAAVCCLLGAAAIWMLSQPMEMRGSFFGG